MRKALFAFVLLCANIFCGMTAAHASMTAQNIFSGLGGTTTMDKGGSMHSQARSIYSMGGGMTSFQGKRVSLLAVDPPSFSAGCSGISWHFGGFSFISADEIRQLVEAVAQASLGVAVDLAMQTLCPQCYAVMSKLRDISNMMRNAAADACKISQNFGSMLSKQLGIAAPGGRNSSCAEFSAESNKDESWIGSVASGACKLLGSAETAVKGAVDSWDAWTKGDSSGKTPSKTVEQEYGNMTYKAMDLLGYKDGVAKDMLMSYLGMQIRVAPAVDCKSALANINGSADADSAPSLVTQKVLEQDKTRAGEIKGAGSTTAPTTANANQKAAAPPATGTDKGPQTCHLPPLLENLSHIGIALICGFDPLGDAKRFANKFHGTGASANKALDMLSRTALGELCNVQVVAATGGAGLGAAAKDFSNPYLYSCRKPGDGQCLAPRMVRAKDLMETEAAGEYTGLAWMVIDALYLGVDAVRDGSKVLPPETIRVLNGSGYPLYRLVNLGAVYPGMADELLQAYGGVIAVQYVMDTLEKVSRVGAQTSMHAVPGGGVAPGELAQIREEISRMFIKFDSSKSTVLRRMNEKRALVEAIVQVNRAVQAEVLSRGLGDNNNMAISLKRQMTDKNGNPTSKP